MDCNRERTAGESTKNKTKCDLLRPGVRVVDRIVTGPCVFDVEDGGLVLRSLRPGATKGEIRKKTEASFRSDLQDATPDTVPTTEIAAPGGDEENR